MLSSLSFPEDSKLWLIDNVQPTKPAGSLASGSAWPPRVSVVKKSVMAQTFPYAIARTYNQVHQ